MKVKTEMMITI